MTNAPMKKSLLLAVASTLALAGGSIAIVNGASASSDDSASGISRADTYLAATARELQGTGHSVDRIRPELVIDGREVYSLEGRNTRCILVAGINQAAGKSESLGCQPSDEARALGSSLIHRSGEGAVDLLWTGESATAISARAAGKDLATEAGPAVLAVRRPDPDVSGTVTWRTAAGQSQSFDLISARELDARRRAALLSAAQAR